MAKVTYIEFNGKVHEVEVRTGQSLMEGATSNMVPGIVADCGGACACATCHVYIDAEWMPRVDAAGEMETAMLDVVTYPEANSRLSCQIRVSDALDGLIVRLPVSQT